MLHIQVDLRERENFLAVVSPPVIFITLANAVPGLAEKVLALLECRNPHNRESAVPATSDERVPFADVEQTCLSRAGLLRIRSKRRYLGFFGVSFSSGIPVAPKSHK